MLNISVVSHNHDPQSAPDVHGVQYILKRKGLYPYTVDGIFGDHSRAAVVKFQALNGLVKDGIVGKATYARLVASDPTRPPVSDAAKMADLAYRLVTTGIDGTRPAYVFGAEVSMYDPSPDRLDCLPADTMIYTSTGARPITEVQVGDEVWSWSETGQMVLAPVTAFLEQGVQQTYKVRLRNRTIRGTAGHKLLRLTRTPGRVNTGRGFLPVDWRTEWVRIDELQADDWLVTARSVGEVATSELRLADGTVVDEDVAWLLGVIIGDGSVTDRGVSVCVYGDLRERVESVIAQVWGVESFFRHESHGTVASSHRLRDVLTSLGMRVRGPQKRVPDLVWLLPSKQQRAFLAGYAAADGHYDKRGHQTYSSASPRLVADVRAMHIALGDRVSNVTTNHRDKPIVIKGKTVQRALPLHSFAVYPGSNQGNETGLGTYGMRRALSDDHFTVERVLAVDEGAVEPTFDLTVEGTHTFVAEGVVSHNCSELVQWAVTQVDGHTWVDGSAAQYGACKHITVADAIHTKGALLFASTNGAQSGVHHVAISRGDGTTAEARSRYMTPNCGSWPVGSRFSLGGLIPVLSY